MRKVVVDGTVFHHKIRVLANITTPLRLTEPPKAVNHSIACYEVTDLLLKTSVSGVGVAVDFHQKRLQVIYLSLSEKMKSTGICVVAALLSTLLSEEKEERLEQVGNLLKATLYLGGKLGYLTFPALNLVRGRGEIELTMTIDIQAPRQRKAPNLHLRCPSWWPCLSASVCEGRIAYIF